MGQVIKLSCISSVAKWKIYFVFSVVLLKHQMWRYKLPCVFIDNAPSNNNLTCADIAVFIWKEFIIGLRLDKKSLTKSGSNVITHFILVAVNGARCFCRDAVAFFWSNQRDTLPHPYTLYFMITYSFFPCVLLTYIYTYSILQYM